ncbi:MAG: T9SS type A sorting domain-containing protein [Aequorivita antarctica]
MKTLLLILVFSISGTSFAQDPQLFENTWYLNKLTLSGIEHVPPYSEPVVEESIFNENPTTLGTGYCDFYGMDIIFDGSANFFEVSSLVTFGDGCLFIENINFNELYLNFFENNTGELNNPFEYEVSTTGNTMNLLITNANGDSALYGDEQLSNKDFQNSQISIYPNPAIDKLYLSATNTLGNLTLKIFNVAGKFLSNQTLELENQTAIDVSNLTSGMYFLNIEDENGNTTIKKFLKE